MSREWPPGWEDPEDAELDAEELDEETDVRLAEVSAFLATVPAPVLPGAIESRIIAALAAESAARGEDSPAPAPEPDGPRILRPRPAPARARVRRPGRVRRFDRIRPAMVAGPLVACLLFAGLGYAISLGGASSSSSAPSAAGAASSAPASSAAASSAAGSASGFSSAAGGDSGVVGTAKTPHYGFVQSGNRYLAATLVTQVRSELAALRSTPAAATALPTTAPSAVPGASNSSEASASSSASAAAIPAALRGCVVHFTGNVAPLLIDLATYQGTPAYVIASASHVWVVGLDCTAQHPDLIASASLAG